MRVYVFPIDIVRGMSSNLSTKIMQVLKIQTTSERRFNMPGGGVRKLHNASKRDSISNGGEVVNGYRISREHKNLINTDITKHYIPSVARLADLSP